VTGPGIPTEELVWDTKKEKRDKTKMRTGLHAIWDAEFYTAPNKPLTHVVQNKALSFLHFSLVEVTHFSLSLGQYFELH
jgi:hypothetical protein